MVGGLERKTAEACLEPSRRGAKINMTKTARRSSEFSVANTPALNLQRPMFNYQSTIINLQDALLAVGLGDLGRDSLCEMCDAL